MNTHLHLQTPITLFPYDHSLCLSLRNNVVQVGTYNVTVMVEGEASLPSPTAILRLNCPKDYFGVDGEPCTPCPVRRCTVKGRAAVMRTYSARMTASVPVVSLRGSERCALSPSHNLESLWSVEPEHR